MKEPMKPLRILTTAGALLGAGTLNTFAASGPPARYVEGELLVKFGGGPHSTTAERARATLKHEVRHNFDFIGWQHIRLPRGMTVEEALVRYRNLPGVLAVEPNGLEPAIQPPIWPAPVGGGAGSVAQPNDPMFSQQWGLARIDA